MGSMATQLGVSPYPYVTNVAMIATVGTTPNTAGYHLDLWESGVRYVKVKSAGSGG